MFEIFIVTFFPLLMVYAIISDLITMNIPNRISLALIIGFTVLALWSLFSQHNIMQMDWIRFAWHWVTFVIVLGISMILFYLGLIGGGDAKLIAVTALWLGWEHVLFYLFATALIGGLLALVFIIARRIPLTKKIAKIPWIARLYKHDNGIPYAVALGFAAIWVYSRIPWVENIYHELYTWPWI